MGPIMIRAATQVTVKRFALGGADLKRHLSVLMVIIGAMATLPTYGVSPPSGGKTESPAAGVAVGRVAPDFKLTDLRTGKTVQLSDFRGKAVLVNFWATWCPACKHEMPAFIALQKIHAAEGFQVIGIAQDDAEAREIAKFADDMNVNYPVLQGTEKASDLYGGVAGLPTTFFIGRDGRVFKQVLGEVSRGEVEQTVKEILSLPESAPTRTARR
jgi:peroxiredoxin